MTDLPEGRHALVRRSMLLVGAAVVAVVVIAVIIFALSSDRPDKEGVASDRPSPSPTPTNTASSSAAPKVSSLASFTGAGNKTTTTFSAAANWEIRWRTEDDKQFSVELLDDDGTSRGEVVAAGKRTQGSVFVSEAGEFKLKVKASRDWSVRIIGRALDK